MKKSFLLVLICCLFGFAMASNGVPVQDAKKVSANYLAALNPEKGISESDLYLQRTVCDEENTPLYYVFGIHKGGFVMVSAMESVSPVLSYSFENEYNKDVHIYAENVYTAALKDAKGTVNEAAAKQWEHYRNATVTRGVVGTFVTAEVAPLTTCTWNQGRFYNNHCPIQPDASQSQHQLDCDAHVPAGCVATAMSMVMDYYRYPEYGVGGVSYQPIHYTVNSANVITDTTVYPRQTQSFNVKHDYNLMTDNLVDYNGEVAKLMWHNGLSVLMDYGPTGSGAQSSAALESMKNNWGYNRTAQQIVRNTGNYTSSEVWIADLRIELDSLRPIYYSASDDHGGHAFVLDGYQVVNTVNASTHYTYGNVFDHIEIDTTYDEDSTPSYFYDSVFVFVPVDSNVVYDTTADVMFHVNWGWGGDLNGYFTLKGGNHLDGYTNNEAAFVGCYPAGNPAKTTEGLVNVVGTAGSISDGAGNQMYLPNTDKSWMISAPGANRYTIKFARIQTEADADEVIFYKNGDMNNVAGRYSGNTVPAQLSINADSVLVRFVSNGNDVTGRGFLFNFTANVPAGYCAEETNLPLGSGTFTDKGDSQIEGVYRPETYCTWNIKGFSKIYLSYPQIELGAGDFIDIFDITNEIKPNLIARIDNYNWPAEDVMTFGNGIRKLRIRFISDNYEEGNGFTMTYETETGVEEHNGLSNIVVYPNPATSNLNVELNSENEGQLNFRIVDMMGRTISNESVENYGGSLHHTINVSNLAKGIYMLRIESEQGNSVKKFVVE